MTNRFKCSYVLLQWRILSKNMIKARLAKFRNITTHWEFKTALMNTAESTLNIFMFTTSHLTNTGITWLGSLPDGGLSLGTAQTVILPLLSLIHPQWTELACVGCCSVFSRGTGSYKHRKDTEMILSPGHWRRKYYQITGKWHSYQRTLLENFKCTFSSLILTMVCIFIRPWVRKLHSDLSDPLCGMAPQLISCALRPLCAGWKVSTPTTASYPAIQGLTVNNLWMAGFSKGLCPVSLQHHGERQQISEIFLRIVENTTY